MKKNIILIIFSLVILGVNAQDFISLQFAQVNSTFSYKNSQGVADDNLNYKINNSYGMSYSKSFDSGLLIRSELSYKNLGANSIFKNQNLDWSLDYIDLNLGIAYRFNKFSVKPYLGGAFYYAYLFKAQQGIGIEYFDMIEEKSIKRNDFGLNIFVGAQYKISEQMSIYLELKNAIGLNQLEPNNGPSKEQELYNRALIIQTGISIAINEIEK
jgi:outer membrane autotransporter protein